MRFQLVRNLIKTETRRMILFVHERDSEMIRVYAYTIEIEDT